MRKSIPRYLIGLALIIALAIGIYYLPPVHSRLEWRVQEIWADIRFFFNPPDEAVFVPTQQAQLDLMVTQTLAAILAAQPTGTPTPSGPTPTPTVTPLPLPASVTLPGVVYVDQHYRWNYCGPANLTMALKFWGWEGDRDDVAAVVKPGEDDQSKSFIDRGRTDLNVMPYELVDFVNDYTAFRALMRYGGDITLIKTLLAGGYPLVVEKGYIAEDTTKTLSWMGHYQFVTGYDDASGRFLVQDAYEYGPNYTIPYEGFNAGWRAFDYLFFIVYPSDREAQVLSLLGSWADPDWARQHALDVANTEIDILSGVDLYFAWFNKGTSHIQLRQYGEAASAFDYAFQLYNALGGEEAKRPYRMMFYQTGPYWAYYYTGRYQDVINLADFTLGKPRTGPTLEESLYWRAMAEYALGQYDAAFEDIRQTVYLNYNFQAGIDRMKEWGVSP